MLTDQIPVSTVNTIEVKAVTLSEGVLEESTGIVTWQLSLAAGEMKEIEVKYTVKYPKGSRVYIE
jgi:proline racemase